MKALFQDKALCRPRAPQCYYVTLPFQERPLQDMLHPVEEEKEAATGSMREKGMAREQHVQNTRSRKGPTQEEVHHHDKNLTGTLNSAQSLLSSRHFGIYLPRG